MDPRVVVRAQQGDKAAFRVIVETSSGRLKQVAYTRADGRAWDERLDIDGNLRIDEADLALVEALIRAHAGQPR